MIIARITKKDDNNVIIWLNDDQKLYLSYEVMLKNGLRTGMELSESHFSLLIRENQKFFIKKSAYNLLARRHHSVREIKNKLRAKKYDLDLIEIVIDELITGKLLDDDQFAKLFAEEKLRTASWGKSKLKAELIKKGISNDIIAVVLDEMINEDDQLSSAIKLAERKYKSLKNRALEKQKLLQKLYAFLLSKGYNYDVSKRAVESLFNLSFEEDS